MEALKEYHHFRDDLKVNYDRVAEYERYIVDTLLESKLLESDVESSICWELKHQASTIQFARILALKRDLPIDICAVGLLLHDIASIMYGKYKDHAQRGAVLAKEILSDLGGFSDEEEKQIVKIIQNHSDKHIWTDDPFKEIGKDVDVLDCFLYKGAFDYYLGNKSFPVFSGYLERAKKIWAELGLLPDIRFNILDNYNDHWFQHLNKTSFVIIERVLAVLLELTDLDKTIGLCPPPFFIILKEKSANFFANTEQWDKYIHDFLLNTDVTTSMQKYRAMSYILANFSKKNYEKLSLDNINLESLSVQHLNLTKNILHIKNHDEMGFLFWPLIDIYESLEAEELNTRLKNVGVIT